MKKVLMVSSEAVPYIKTGGLADVVGSLPRYVEKEEYDVRVILPKYACMDQRFLPDLQFVCHFYVNLNWRKQYAGIFKSEYKGVTYYFVDNEFYFAGNNPYNNIHEDVEKFAFFSKAVLMALPYIDFCPDVIHCNDWQTGLIPVFLKTEFYQDSYYIGMKTVFSIHNMKFQGRWHVRDIMDVTGLPASIFTADKLESYGEANYLKGGCVYADAISTVSPSYAVDITTPEGGEGLDGLMSARRDSLYGIVNGIDYDDFNPMTDAAMVEHFSVKDVVKGKKANKRALQQSMGLPEKEDAFLVGMVSRLTDQKGFDLVAYVMEEMLTTMNVQFVVLGTGEYRFEEMFHYFQGKYPDKISSYIGYSEEKAHQIYASCDAFLMPSLFEPCGLSQMMSMRYGTIPIVRETGGLKDTVEPYNEFENKGTGFSFATYNAHDMMHVIQYAYRVFTEQKKQWEAIMKRAMEQDFSWKASARKYEELYDKLMEK
ncbi:MAG: glycogen synthase GlgA [Agathobacter sp.]|nr:glycogen synthase GlgA [Agathobacter sp.]